MMNFLGIRSVFGHYFSRNSLFSECIHRNNVVNASGRISALASCRRNYTGPTITGSEDILSYSTEQFLELMRRERIERAHVVFDESIGRAVASHPALQPVADYCSKDIDCEHCTVFFARGHRSNYLLGAFIWRTDRGQAHGGIRFWRYSNMEKYMKDGLRLAHGMGVKAALAGLWCGGGQGVIAQPQSHQHLLPDFRQKIFMDYGDFLTSLNGCFIAAGDVGMMEDDVTFMYKRSRYVTGLSQEIGGMGETSIPAALGVISAMEGALDYLSMGGLAGKTVAIQGAGNVAAVMIQELLERNVGEIVVSECNQKRLQDVHDKFVSESRGRLKLKKVEIDDVSILSQPCDILSPCALGSVLTEDTIPSISAKIVCGAANNQLGKSSDNKLLMSRGISYVPDFLANRMGLVSAANEIYGRITDDPAIYKHFDKTWDNSIYVMTKRILAEASSEKITTAEAAMKIAEKLSIEHHPIWPARASSIISGLVRDQWHLGHNFWKARKPLNAPSV